MYTAASEGACVDKWLKSLPPDHKLIYNDVSWCPIPILSVKVSRYLLKAGSLYIQFFITIHAFLPQ